MAKQRTQSFDYETDPTKICDQVSGTAVISAASARFQTAHAKGVSISQNSYMAFNTVGNQATLIAHVAIKMAALPSNNTDFFINFVDVGNAQQVTLSISSTGVMQFFRDIPSLGHPIGSAGSTNYTAGVWHHLGALTTINNTTGVVQGWLDGQQVINSSGLNTRASSNNFANQVRIGEMGNNMGPVVFDDFILLDGTGATLNGFLGDRRIGLLVPNGAGSFTQFAPSGFADNWHNVSDIPADDATTYNSDATVGHRDSYTFESIFLPSGNADFIVPKARISKDDAAAHTVQLSATDTGNDAFSSSIAVPSSYSYVEGDAVLTSPNGAAAWSQTVINRTEWGIKLVS